MAVGLFSRGKDHVISSKGTPGSRALRHAVACAVELLEERRLFSFTVTTLDDNTSAGSLRYAITQANTAGGDQTINFAGTLSGSIDLGSQLPDITADITINGPGAGALTVNGNYSAGIIFTVDSGADAQINGLTIEDGVTYGDNGGGIVNSGTLAVNACTFIGNSSGGSGGGIYNDGTLAVNASDLDGNYSEAMGGGIYSSGNLTITDTTIASCQATEAGGGIWTGVGTASIEGSTISDNSSEMGGGVWEDSGTLTVSNSTLKGNTTSYFGGAVAGAGMSIVNTTVDDNSASSYGGGIYDFSGSSIVDCTVIGNSVSDDSGGGIGFGGDTTLDGTVIASSTGGDVYNAGSGTITGSYDLIGDGSDSSGLTDSQTGTTGDPLDPELGALADNGGPTETIFPESGSPAIGNGSTFSDADGVDQRGVPRPSTGVDIGAVQTLGIVTGSVTDADIGANNAGMSGETVYADLGDSGSYTSGDPMATTDSNGNFTLSGIPLNSDEVIRVEPIAGWSTVNSSSSDGSQTVDLTSAAPTGAASFGEMRQLAAPSDLAGAIGASSEIDLSWQANTTLNTGYDLQVSEDGGAFTTVVTEPAATATTFAVTGLDTTSHDYVFRIAATDANGDSEFSNTADAAAPSAPTNPEADVDGSIPSVTVSWTAPASGATVDGYYVYKDGALAPTATLAATTTSWTDTSVSLGDPFSYTITAYSAAVGTTIPQSGGLSITGNVTSGYHEYFDYSYAGTQGAVINPGGSTQSFSIGPIQLGPSSAPTHGGNAPTSTLSTFTAVFEAQSQNLGSYSGFTAPDSYDLWENNVLSDLWIDFGCGSPFTSSQSIAVNNGTHGEGVFAGAAEVADVNVSIPSGVGIAVVARSPSGSTQPGFVTVGVAASLEVEYTY